MHGSQIAQVLNMHQSSTNRLITSLVKLGIIKELTGYKRNRIYAFDLYINLFSKIN